MCKNFFSIFNLPISIKIDVSKLDLKYKEVVKNSTTEEMFEITNAYNTLRSTISRGEHILKIMNVDYSEIQMPEDFFENIIDLEKDKMKNLSDEIFQGIDEIVTKENIQNFATKFMMYKYTTNHL
jgi:hypothetical protein